MSLWIRRKDRTGRMCLCLIDTDPTVLLVLWSVCFVLIMTHPETLATAALVILAAGVICFAAAKVSLCRQGIWISWGAQSMTKRYAGPCRMGYALMGSGLVLYVLARLISA